VRFPVAKTISAVAWDKWITTTQKGMRCGGRVVCFRCPSQSQTDPPYRWNRKRFHWRPCPKGWITPCRCNIPVIFLLSPLLFPLHFYSICNNPATSNSKSRPCTNIQISNKNGGGTCDMSVWCTHFNHKINPNSICLVKERKQGNGIPETKESTPISATATIDQIENSPAEFCHISDDLGAFCYCHPQMEHLGRIRNIGGFGNITCKKAMWCCIK